MKNGKKTFLSHLISYMKDNGIIYGPSPEIYGGLSGFYTYGPFGKKLKNSIENYLRKHLSKLKFWEVELPTIMPEVVWKASGHLDNFTDPVITCSQCNAEFRADTLIEEQLGKEVNSLDEIKEDISKLKCPSCDGKFKNTVEMKTLMLKTEIGSTTAFARPETATTTYLPFLQYYNFFRKKLPFGVFQIGKAYRNEINPRQHLLRCREFTQAEAQLFIFENQKTQYHNKLNSLKVIMNLIDKNEKQYKLTPKQALENKLFQNSAYTYLVSLTYNSFLGIGFNPENIRLRQHKDDEKAFYALDAWDIELKLNSFSWKEVCGIHDRSDYDLNQHSKYSQQELKAFNYDNHKNETPHIIEIAYGVDRILFSIIDNSFQKLDRNEGKTTLKISKTIAPIQIAIFPLMKKEPLLKKAQEIYEQLSNEFTIFYDESGPIGKRYLRANKLAIPYAITIDYSTLEESTVTIRDRDSEKQIKIRTDELQQILQQLLTDKTINDYNKYLIN